MSRLAEAIQNQQVENGSLAIYWLSQAGFVFKSTSGEIVYIDPYFSDVVERKFGFKRMMMCPILPEEVNADLVVCTHEHLDHMDTDGLPVLARNPDTHFAGPVECFKEFEKMRIAKGRCHLLEDGQEMRVGGIKLKVVYADHGDLAPDAVGVIFTFDGISVYHTGDTAYRPTEFRGAIDAHPDVLIPCINGRYGNMDARDAARLTEAIKPRLVIPCHFWMFIEHNGDPAAFSQDCAKLAPDTEVLVMKPGERHVFRKS